MNANRSFRLTASVAVVACLVCTASSALLRARLADDPPAVPAPTKPAQPDAPARHPDGSVIVTPENLATIDFAREWDLLVKRHQSPTGRDESTPNGWPHLIAAARMLKDISMKAESDARRERGDDRRVSVNFTVLRDNGAPPDDPDFDLEATRAVTRRAMKALGESAFDKELDAVAAAHRFVPPMVGTLEYLSNLVSFGVTPPEESVLVQVLPIDAGQCRTIASLMCARLHDAAKSGEWNAAVQAIERGLAVSRAISHGPTLIHHLVGHAVMQSIVKETLDAVSRFQVPEPILIRIREVLARQANGHPNVTLAFEGERLVAMDAYKRLFKPDGTLDLARVGPFLKSSLRAPPPQGMLKQTVRLDVTIRRTDEFIAQAKTWGILASPVRKETPDPDDALVKRDPRDAVVQIFMAAISKAAMSNDVSTSYVAALRTVLAAELLHRRTGKWPTSWDDLVGKTTDTPEIDPFSGKPLILKPTAAPGLLGRTYMVYTVAADTIDDGGKEHPEDTMNAYFPSRGKGFDFIFFGRPTAQRVSDTVPPKP